MAAAESEPIRAFADIPEGPLRQGIAALKPEAQAKALATLAKVHATADMAHELRVTTGGNVCIVCPAPAPRPARAVAPAASAPLVLRAPVPVASPPEFNSKPGSPNTIVLDFSGGTITGTDWNDTVATFVVKPFDTDGNLTTFSDSEQTFIKQVWQRVAEDYAPFEVNVTTKLPAAYGPRIGRVMICGSKDANGNDLPASSAGGVAYLGVFGAADYTTYQPAWVNADNLGPNAADLIAEAASHEMGHNMGLTHDGTTTSSYYGGHGTGDISWGPLMGTGYDRNVSQWSKGEYRNANNTQDDLNIIQGKIGYRVDDYANTIGTALALTPSATGGIWVQGIIERSTDVDIMKVVCGAGTLTVNARPWISPVDTKGGNLDIVLELLNASGTVIASNNPGLVCTASLSLTPGPGTYYVRISATGAGTPLANPPSGYTSYGSLGQWFVTGTVPLGVDTTAPTVVAGNIPNVVNGFGRTSYDFTVVYSDDAAINAATFDGLDITVMTPGGGSLTAAFVSASVPGNGTPRTVTYRITPPGGSWDSADNGTYTVKMTASQVADTSGNFVAAGTIATFTVDGGSTPTLSLLSTILSGPVPLKTQKVQVNGVDAVITGIDPGRIWTATVPLPSGASTVTVKIIAIDNSFKTRTFTLNR